LEENTKTDHPKDDNLKKDELVDTDPGYCNFLEQMSRSEYVRRIFG